MLLLFTPTTLASPNKPPHIVGSLKPNDALFVIPDTREGSSLTFFRLTPGPDRELETLTVPAIPANPTHAAAVGHTLWIITPERQVRSVTLEPLPGPIPRSQVATRNFPDLPPGTIPRALTIHQDQPYLLARIESQATLDLLQSDATTTPRPSRFSGLAPPDTTDRRAQLKRNIALDLPLDYTPPRPQSPAATQPATSPATQPDTPPAPPSTTQPTAPDPQPTTADRLLVLQPDGWHAVPLPPGWDHPKGNARLLSQPGHTHPSLLVQTPAGWTLYEHPTDAWSARSVQLPAPPDTATDSIHHWSVRVIAGQTVLAWQTTPPQPDADSTVTLGLIRDDRVLPLGSLSITESDWSLAATPDAAAILTYRTPQINDDTAQPDQHFLRIQTLRLDDAAVTEPQTVFIRADTPALQSVGFIILVVIMVSVAAMLALFWRRPIDQQQPQLPDTLAVADLLRRALAGFLDLAPGFLLASLLFDTDPGTIIAFWPGNTSVGHLEAIRPGLFVVALTVLHTTVTEALTQRSLGKAIFGLRVADLQGKPPSPAALIRRGLLKPFDLIAWLLLVVPIISPHRQRLADLMSKTVVVTTRPKAQDDPTNPNP